MVWQDLPPLRLYGRLIPFWLRLCLKYKAFLSIIVNANPALPYGGLPFASKSKISSLFKGVLPYKLISMHSGFGERLKAAQEFTHKTGFPVIAKPDTGHRGVDIRLIKNKAELQELLSSQTWDIILQEYSDDPLEFGIFYCKLPGEKKGKIISLSQKVIPVLLGDGKSSIEKLINQSSIDNKEAIKEALAGELHAVPRTDESIKTLVSASHCLGSMFYNVEHLLTHELLNKTEEICGIKGFYFGRLDVKAKSIESFKKGKFKIIEINGATSESIHIYDKQISFQQGIQTLKQQWRYLFAIAHHHRTSKNRISPLRFLVLYLRFFFATKKATGRYW